MSRTNKILALLVLLGLVLRLWFIAANVIDARFSAADDGDYYQRALRFAATGEYVDNSWLIRPPLHVLLFSALLRGAIELGQPAWGQLLIRAVHVLLSLWSILIGYGLARRLFGPGPGIAFAALLALWFPMVELPALILSEPLFFFLLLLHFYLLVRWRDERDQPRAWRWLVLAGVSLGLCALARSLALYAAAFSALYLLLELPKTKDERRRTNDERQSIPAAALSLVQPKRNAGSTFASNLLSSIVYRLSSGAAINILIFGLACMVVVAPWTLRNYLTYQRFIPIDTLGPVNLWLALYSEDGEGKGKGILASIPQAERQEFVVRQIREAIVNDPARLFRSAWPHFRHIWKAQFIEDFWVKASFYTRPLRAVWPMGILGDLLWFVFTIGGLVALAAPFHNKKTKDERRKTKDSSAPDSGSQSVPNTHVSATTVRPSSFVLRPSSDGPFRILVLCWLGYSVLTVMLLHIEPRYLLPIWLLMGLYGAWAVGDPRGLLAQFQRRRFNTLLGAGFALVFLYLFWSYRDYPDVIARGVQRERLIAAGQQHYAAGDFVAAEQQFRAAVALHPYFTDGRTELALALVAQARYDEALVALDKGDTHRSNVVRGEIARAAGKYELAATYFNDAEFRAGEDIQALTLEWFRPPHTNSLQLGDGLDFGYLLGFSPGEEGPVGSGVASYRWLQGDGRLVLPLTRPLQAGDALELRMTGGPDGPTPLTVTLAGHSATLAVRTGEWRVYRIVVPDALVGQEVIAVTLHAPTFIPAHVDAASTDTRPLSLMISQVNVQ